MCSAAIRWAIVVSGVAGSQVSTPACIASATVACAKLGAGVPVDGEALSMDRGSPTLSVATSGFRRDAPAANPRTLPRMPPLVSELVVQGFRSVMHTRVTLEPLCALVGEPETGKSNLLAALRAVLDPAVDPEPGDR